MFETRCLRTGSNDLCEGDMMGKDIRYDVIVVGAGPAGTPAAIAAARRGCKTLLVERYGFAGGMATVGLVNPFLGNYYKNPETGGQGSIIEGIYREVTDRLDQRGAFLRFHYGDEKSPFADAFDETPLRVVYDELLAEAGVTVLYHAWLLDAKVTDGHVESVRVMTKGGIETFEADMFIDSTGDADLAASAGVAFDMGRKEDGLCQPLSTMFHIGGIDKESLLNTDLRGAREKINGPFSKAREAGEVYSPNISKIGIYEYPRPGVLHFNATRILDAVALNSEDLTKCEIEGRKQADALCQWMRRSLPEFKHAFLETVATQVGVRESRRIQGEYRMTQEDIVEGARFEDGIARAAYFIDIHNPKGAGGLHADPDDPARLREDCTPKRYYEIPFRSLSSPNADNLLVACRAISTTFEAHGATRVMATMHAIGEAAGIAVGLAKGKNLSDIRGEDVRQRLGYLDGGLDF